MKTEVAEAGGVEYPEEPGGFVAGTLVHTSEGPRPIEAIAVGDHVLCRPPSGVGEPTRGKVTRTFSHEGREVYFLYYTIVAPGVPIDRHKNEVLVLTATQPFWVRRLVDEYGEGSREIGAWMSGRDLFEAGCRRMWDSRNPLPAELALHDGQSGMLWFNEPLLRTAREDHGIAFGAGEYWQELISGVLVAFGPRGPRVDRDVNGALQTAAVDVEEEDIEGAPKEGVFYRSGGFHPMRRHVFGIQIDGNQTYYVGEAGVLVRDASGSRTRLPGP